MEKGGEPPKDLRRGREKAGESSTPPALKVRSENSLHLDPEVPNAPVGRFLLYQL